MNRERKSEIRTSNYLSVPIEVYGFWVHFVYGLDIGEAKEFLESTFSNNTFEIDENYAGITFNVNSSHSVIVFPTIAWDFVFWGTFVHEVFHATCNVMSQKPIRLTNDSEEAFAYLIGYITKTFVKKYTKQQKRIDSVKS